MPSPSDLKKTLANLQEALENSEKINLAFFAAKLEKHSDLHPEDQTIGQINQVIGKINRSSNQLFISRAEIKDLYRRLYSRNTKFAEVFSEELGQTAPLATPTIYPRPESDFSDLDASEGVDQVLSASLQHAFGDTPHPVPGFLAQAAEKLVGLECSFPKMVPQVQTVGGNADCVICSASYGTPKGQATFYVPVEIINKKATIPQVFVGKTGPQEISRNNIEQYLEDFFVAKGSYGNSEVKDEVPEVTIEQPSDPELESFAWQFDSPAGLAAFSFGPRAEAARQWVSKKLYSLGKNAHQVSVLSSDDKGIVFGVKCDSLAFKVPMRVSKDRFDEPNVILCNGGIESFSSEGLKNLLKKAGSDNQVAAAVSSLGDLKPSELVGIVEQAVGEENYAKAEDAMNVLAYSGDEKAYKTAFEVYSGGLKGMEKVAAGPTCSRIVKNSTSTQPLCGHLNLPLSKVYVDQNGDCHPNYRKATVQTSEASSSLNSKVII